MQYLTGNAQQLGATLVDALGRYRHRVFVEHLGWKLPNATQGAEWDAFDTPGTVYVVALCDHGRIAGCARLLPTTDPYLLADVFPELLNGTPCPRSSAVWELSRFAAFEPEAPPARGHTLGSPAALDLLRVSLREAAHRGARQLVSVSPAAITRILHRGGFAHARLGPPREVAGQQLFACSFNVAPKEERPSGLEAARSAVEVEAQ